MSFIKRIVGLIFNRWMLIAVGIAVLLVLIWWVGPMIAISNVYPFQADWVRWLQTAIVVVFPIARGVWGFFKARRANAKLREGLVQPTAADARPGPASDEVLQLRKRFDEALEVLRNLGFGGKKPPLWARLRSLGSRQYLYELPWYVFIGAPGAGKTTALVNSGLRFPLAERFGQEGIRGVGGTRNCDWWFTEEAVFLDTAGRYTTQESDRDADAAAWKGFLQLLKRSRTRRPINGVLATVSVGDLLQQSAAETEAQAKAIRARVHELHADLGIRFPVYVLVTKSDLLPGFTEFFASLGKEERAQVWGCSLGLSDKGVDTAALSAELERLERRLYERLPGRLEEERDPARRPLIYGFPQQFALLRERLVAFVEASFAPEPLRDRPPGPRCLFHERHPGRQPDRPCHRRRRAGLRARAKAAAGAASERAELLPDAPAPGGRVRRGGPGRPGPALGTPPPAAALGCDCGGRDRRRRRHRRVVAQLSTESAVRRRRRRAGAGGQASGRRRAGRRCV
jgi:type VI secretion system protein ImpL